MQDLFDMYTGLERVGPDGTVYRTTTQRVVVERGIGARLHEVFSGLVDASGTIAVIGDENTFAAAGSEALESLGRFGAPVRVIELAPRAGHEIPVCDDETLDAVGAALADAGASTVVTVGSGTISDLGKMTAHRLGIPDLAVGTAPSNNGYTSAIAAILSKGVKTTQPCRPALAVVADPQVMAAAPYRMIASGIGDLYSKPVSNADWRLSYRLNDSFFSEIVMEIVDAGNALLEGVAPRLPERDEDAVARLTGAIMLSGLGMQAAGSSGPASGGEHLVSHYLDMTEDIDGEPHDLHGVQVAVGTLFTATMYERLRALDPAGIDIAARVAALPAWSDYREVLRGRFGVLADSVLEHAEKGFPSGDELRARLERLVAGWDEIMAWVGETLRPPADLAAELISARCPVRFDEIGVSEARAVRTVQHCKDIRNRYTVLHLLWELGLLDGWGEAYVRAQYRPS
jgi:glycerol-1-phosphate dehydrogenase [NAD(P)+]